MKKLKRTLEYQKKRDAFVLIDVINDFDFSGPEALLPCALFAAEHIAALRKERERREFPDIYRRQFRAMAFGFRQQIENCLEKGRRGANSSSPKTR